MPVYKIKAGIAFEPQFPPQTINLSELDDVILRARRMLGL